MYGNKKEVNNPTCYMHTVLITTCYMHAILITLTSMSLLAHFLTKKSRGGQKTHFETNPKDPLNICSIWVGIDQVAGQLVKNNWFEMVEHGRSRMCKLNPMNSEIDRYYMDFITMFNNIV